MAAHDSVGGVVECRASGAGIGLGEPFFDSAESVISHLMFSVPAVKGIEFGSGFGGVRLRGSERNDRIADAEGHTFSNNEGGIVGGITNGNEIVVRVALKPTPSIAAPQQTFDFAEGRVAPLCIRGRHDAASHCARRSSSKRRLQSPLQTEIEKCRPCPPVEKPVPPYRFGYCSALRPARGGEHRAHGRHGGSRRRFHASGRRLRCAVRNRGSRRYGRRPAGADDRYNTYWVMPGSAASISPSAKGY